MTSPNTSVPHPPIVLYIAGDGAPVLEALGESPLRESPLLSTKIANVSPLPLAELLGCGASSYLGETLASGRNCSALAMAAWQQCVATSGTREQAMGIGLMLGPLEMDRGRPVAVAHLAMQTLDRTVSICLTLDAGHRQPADRQRLAAELIVRMLQDSPGPPPEILPSESLQVDATAGAPDWQALLCGAADAVCHGEVEGEAEAHSTGLIFPGSFHPLHEGHRQMARDAAKRLGRPVEFELSIANVDKPLLDYRQIAERCRQFPASQPLWLTRAPTFVDKARLFPAATFIVGVDTLIRIADARYYGQCEARRDDALRMLREQDCQFLVFGRQLAGSFHTLADLQLPAPLRERCAGVGQEDFQHDISSSELRGDDSEPRRG